MTEVTLAQILVSRENRVKWQRAMLGKHNCPLVCFTMNIAGPVKNTPLIQRGFQAGMTELEKALPKGRILDRFVDVADTGNTAIYAVNMNAEELKQICVSIEDATSLGRLFDMDVIDTNCRKLDRANQRGCIVCGAQGRTCAAGQVHTVAELQTVTRQILRDHLQEADQAHIASFAVKSLIDEVNTTPKPGLVDRRNNGSHTDMTPAHFIASANALGPYFKKCVQIGQETAGELPQDTFLRLRQAGLKAEQGMIYATGGVNTHKGVIYTLGVLCGCLGRLWSEDTPYADLTAIAKECRKMVADSVASDFSKAKPVTAGIQLYLQHGIGGIRAEVAAGLPSVINTALPFYRQSIADGLSPNDAGVLTLLHLITQVEDTNLFHRGGIDGAAWAADTVKTLLKTYSHPSTEQIESLDDAFIERNLSPGGCADLLAVTYFLYTLYP